MTPLLTPREAAALLKRSYKAMQNAGIAKCWPPPIADADGVIRPYRFHPDTVAAYMAGNLPRPKRRRLTPRQFRRSAAA